MDTTADCSSNDTCACHSVGNTETLFIGTCSGPSFGVIYDITEASCFSTTGAVTWTFTGTIINQPLESGPCTRPCHSLFNDIYASGNNFQLLAELN